MKLSNITHILATTLLAFAATQLIAAPKDTAISRITESGSGKRTHWGVYAVELDSGRVLADVNGSKLFVPASNRKVVSTAMAVSVFDPEEKFTTELLADTISGGGLLSGDLVLDAKGDPTWTPSLMGGRSGTSVLQSLARQAAQSGIRQVRGDLVISSRRFESADLLPNGWVWNDLSQSYAGHPATIGANNNLVGLRMWPTGVGNAVGTEWAIPIEPMAINNNGMTGPSGSVPTLHLERGLSGVSVSLSGRLPSNAERSSRAVPLGQPTEVWGRLLKYYLEQEGVRVNGRVVISSDVDWPANSVASHTGAPMKEILAECNEQSDNYLAESLYVLAAGKRFGRAGYQNAHRMEESFWKELGISMDEVSPSDGSGLSRENSITPNALVTLLREYHSTDWYVSSLPVSGRSGTLRYRLSQDGMLGRVRAKTGTLTGVSALSGYVTTNSGKTVVFSILANNYTGQTSRIRRIIDEVVVELAR